MLPKTRLCFIIATAMSGFEEISNPELQPENQVFIDLVEQIEISVDDAFDESLRQIHPSDGEDKSKSIVELIQFDTHSLAGERVFSILKTESGGKPDRGVEKIRALARPSRPFESVREAVESTLKPNVAVPYRADSFYIAHQMRDGDWRYSRVDNDGIYPWMPQLRDIHSNAEHLSLENINILEAIQDASHPASRAQEEMRQKQLRQLDKAYALELIAKLDQWPVIPQN